MPWEHCGGMTILQLCTVSNTLKGIHREVGGNKRVKYSSEASAVCCLTPLLGAVIYYTVTVHLNTLVQPEVVEDYHCRCDPRTMKLDHSGSQVSVHLQSTDLSTHVERYSEFKIRL